MRVLVTGATGLIGSAVVARLMAEGHDITGIARDVARAARRGPDARWVSLDMARATDPKAWIALMDGVEAVVNCAGVLQDSARDSTSGVHERGAAALFAACEQAGIPRVIHISAIGVDRETPSAFSATKARGDEALMQRDLDWVILRPSVVVGRPVYGGSALFRGLAALPILPVMPHTAPLQIVQLDEVVATVLFFLRRDAPARIALDVCGPERLHFADVVRHYRRWLGYPDARRLPLPAWLAGLLFRLGDFMGWLGWRPPMRSTARREIARGAIGDHSAWQRLTGIAPRPLAAALMAEPASVQERWFANLYLLKAIGFTSFALFWIATGVISLGPGWSYGVGYMMAGNAGWLAAPSVAAGALADIIVGLLIAFRRTTRLGLYLALAISMFYIIAGTAILPALWADPLGPMLKIWPILCLNLMLLAILEDR